MPEPAHTANRLIAQHKWLSLWTGYNDEPFVESSPGVAIIPINYAGEVLFIHEPAVTNGQRVLTLPAGAVEVGEDPAEAANRELQEEIGYKADVLFPLGALQPLSRHAIWTVHLFLARNLMPSRKMGDEIYQITIERVPFEGFESVIADGRLRDSTWIAGLYLARSLVQGKLTDAAPPGD